MTKVDVLPPARDDFRSALRWYRDRSARAARRFALEVKIAISAIREHPERYAKWDDRYRFRMLKRFPYYVAYRHTSDSVVIVAIRHAARDQDAWRTR
jgi:plasmid stabilization system protein ParE